MSIGGKTRCPSRSIKTTQSAFGSAGGWPSGRSAPPAIVVGVPTNSPVRGLNQRSWPSPLQVRQVERASRRCGRKIDRVDLAALRQNLRPERNRFAVTDADCNRRSSLRQIVRGLHFPEGKVLFHEATCEPQIAPQFLALTFLETLRAKQVIQNESRSCLRRNTLARSSPADGPPRRRQECGTPAGRGRA